MSFRLRYYAELRSKFKEVFWRVEIAERGYSGSSEEMSFDGSNPLQITWEQRGDEFFVPVKGSEATVNILCRENFHYLNLFTSDPRKFRVSIFRNKKLYWRGYVVADLYSEKFTAPPYTVSIKAVDGFSLLSNVPFPTATTGRKSTWELIASCIELLELEVSIADWMDLYAEGMTPSASPLRQVYIDMAQLFNCYEEPTYRDVLELCLRPFAAQIFQSNGALHIRRAISLYSDTRPLSFYDIGAELPRGWLTTASDDTLLTALGEPIVVHTVRERIESMWEGDINIQGESSTLDIVAPLRKVTVNVTNRLYDNILIPMGVFAPSAWNIPSDVVVEADHANYLAFRGNDTTAGRSVECRYAVEQSTDITCVASNTNCRLLHFVYTACLLLLLLGIYHYKLA